MPADRDGLPVWTQAAFVTVRAATREEAAALFGAVDGTLVGVSESRRERVELSLDGYPEPMEVSDDA